MWVLINALCKRSLGTYGLLIKILQAENGQKVDEFEPIYFGNYRYLLRVHGIYSKVKSIYLFVFLFYDAFFRFFSL